MEKLRKKKISETKVSLTKKTYVAGVDGKIWRHNSRLTKAFVDVVVAKIVFTKVPFGDHQTVVEVEKEEICAINFD